MKDPDAKSNIPWSVKGVSKEAREAAKKAAAARGITMGEWLSEAIRTSPSDDQPAQDVPDQTDLPASSAVPSTGESNSVELNDPAEMLRRGITERIAHSEERILGVIGPLREIIQQMALRIEALEDRGSQKHLDAPAPQPPTANVYRKTGWDE